jgi:hypothetical protein
MAVKDEKDDFGLCSSDESDFIALSSDVRPSAGFKRKLTDETYDGLPSKRPAPDHPSQSTLSASKTMTYPAKSSLAVKVLNEQFAHSQFRLKQEAVVARLLAGGSAVVVFPTGGGKSLCYQVRIVHSMPFDDTLIPLNT